jgi:hypothetical protein
MKFTKKLTVLFLTLALVVGTTITAFATPNNDILAALKAAKVPETYIIQAENYLKTRTLTAAESSSVVAQIESAIDIINASGKTDLTQLSSADKSKIIALIKSAGDSLNLTITFVKQSNGHYSVVAKDETGSTVLNFTPNQVKQTGIDNTLIYVGTLLVILSAGSVFVLRKKNLITAA